VSGEDEDEEDEEEEEEIDSLVCWSSVDLCSTRVSKL